MLVGLQGAGKTTTAAKLALHVPKHSGKEVLLVSTDVYRPAARTQLAKLAADNQLDYYAGAEGEPVAIARAALAAAQKGGHRWLILDTAGRLHVDDEMMEEARALQQSVEPTETLFVVDSMAGQDALNAARAFHQALPLTGVILTKADGDARGGAALSVREVTGLPIKLVGTGEKVDALEAFEPARFAARILGMGDVVGLVEQVQRQVDREADGAACDEGEAGPGVRIRRLSRAAEATRQHGRTRAAPRQASGRQAGSLGGRSLRSEVVASADRHYRLDDAAGASPSGDHRRLA